MLGSMMPDLAFAEPQTLADFHELGKFLYYAKRFASNQLVQRTLHAASPRALDPIVAEHLETFVRDLLETLSSRQRTIVERYEFADEACATIARELGISTRHFWREHREANQRLAELLKAAKPPLAVTTTATASDAFEEHLRLSRVLDSNGRDQECIALLEHLSENVDRVEQRVDVELRLSGLYRERGRITLSRHHAETARAMVAHVDAPERWREFEVEAAFAPILDWVGERDRALEISQRCVTQLRSWVDQSRAVESALANLLCWRAQRFHARSEYKSALESATDARAITSRLSQPDPSLQLLTQLTHTFLSHAQQATDGGRAQYLECYHTATANGLTREALWSAAAVSATYLLESQPAKALAFLEPLLETAKSLAPSQGSLVVLGNAVDAYIQIGNVTAATSYLRYMEQPSIVDLDFFALGRWLTALAHLKSGEYAAALSASEAAEAIFARIGSKRPLQRALLVQGEALVALGRFAQARRVLRAVISGDDPRLLARAYTLMALISEDRRYSALAQELRQAKP
jgi:hypothetical protein